MTQPTELNYILIGHRKGKGLKQSQYAHMMGISQSLLSQLENGTKEPSFDTAKKLATEIGVDVGILFKRFQ